MAGFDVPADTYDRFMGRFSQPLAPIFCDAVLPGGRLPASVLDVGCGPGALLDELVRVRRGEAELIEVADVNARVEPGELEQPKPSRGGRGEDERTGSHGSQG